MLQGDALNGFDACVWGLFRMEVNWGNVYVTSISQLLYYNNDTTTNVDINNDDMLLLNVCVCM